MLIAHLIPKGIEAKQKSDRKGGARSQARSSRKISDVMDFHTFSDPEMLQTAAHRGVLNSGIYADILHFRIGNTAVIFEKRRQPSARNEAGFIDGGRED